MFINKHLVLQRHVIAIHQPDLREICSIFCVSCNSVAVVTTIEIIDETFRKRRVNFPASRLETFCVNEVIDKAACAH